MIERSPVVIAVPFRVPFYAPFYAAVERGAYTRQGIEVRMEIAGSGQAIVDALRAGTADVAWGGPARVMHEIDADPASPLRCFCFVVKRDPFLLVGRRPRPAFKLQDLPNFTMGSVSEVPTPWLCLQDDLRRLGTDPDTVRRIADRTMQENASAVASGALDVAQLFEPHASLLESRGTGSVWAAAADRGDTAYTSFIATTWRIEERRADFRAMCRAMAETLSWVGAEGPDALTEAVHGHYPDLERDILKRALERYFKLGIWSPSIHISRQSFDRLAQALFSAGSVTQLPRYEACVDASLAEEALQESNP